MFFDIGTGIIAAILLSKFQSNSLTSFTVLAGIIFNLLPDADFLVYLFQKRTSANAHNHRDLFHLPIPYLLIGTVLLYVLKPSWVLLFVITSLLHFLHDSIALGWGIQWLWPFNKNHFAFLYIYKPKGKPKITNQLVYSWRHSEIDQIAKTYGDEKWIKNIYFKAHPIALIEFLVFTFSLILLWRIF